MAALDSIRDNDLYPLSSPPQGITPNFTNPPDRTYQLYIVAAVCLTLILVFASLRLYAKLCILRTFRRDDYAYILAVTVAIVDIISYTVIAAGPVSGRHSWDVPIGDLSVPRIQLLMTTVIAYGPFVWIIKLSLFLLLLEAFGSLRWLRHLIYTGILVTGIVHGSICIALAAACIPRHDNSKLAYLTAISAPRCARNYYLNVWPGLFNIFSDCYLLILPLPAVWHLHLPTGKKVGITMMFLTGLAACICSVLALIYRSILQSHPNDSNWYGIPVSCVGIAEFTAGVIIPSVPATNAVYRHLRPAISGHVSSFRRRMRGMLSSRSTNKGKVEDSFEMGI